MTREPIAAQSSEVADWLLESSRDPRLGLLEWDTIGMTLLECGELFTAIRLPVSLVEAAAGATDPDVLNEYLDRLLFSRPVIRCNLGRWYYVLVPPEIAEWWRLPDGECLQPRTGLGVPRPDLVKCPGRTGSYWAVPMRKPGDLAAAEVVAQLIGFGRYNNARGSAS